MIGVTCTVVVKKSGAVPRSQGKAVRVKDLRKKRRIDCRPKRIRPQSGLNRKCLVHARNDVDDPPRARS